MRAKRIWTIQSLLTCLLWNAVLLTLLFLATKELLNAMHQWVNPFLAADAALPDDARSAFTNIDQLIKPVELYLAPALFGFGGLITLFLWLFVMMGGRKLARRVEEAVDDSAARRPDVSRAKDVKKAREEKGMQPKQDVAPEPQYVQSSPQAAVQMLSVLQREGRLIDFFQEDLSLYDDTQIGAAVRSIHEGCKGALKEYVDLEPIYSEAEGVEVTVPKGFDSKAVRLTGNISGDPPFKGILRHRGWQVRRVTLPLPTTEQKKDWILAPAEVEIAS
jgi:hypothetical protein